MSKAPPRLYFLQNSSAGYLGNSPLWWQKDGAGYTSKLGDAKRFTFKECQSIIRETRGSHKFKAWPADCVLSAAHLCLDIQDYKPTATTPQPVPDAGEGRRT